MEAVNNLQRSHYSATVSCGVSSLKDSKNQFQTMTWFLGLLV